MAENVIWCGCCSFWKDHLIKQHHAMVANTQSTGGGVTNPQ